MRLHLADCLEVLPQIPDNMVHAIITDPPYGLSAARNSGRTTKGGFMGMKWDVDVPPVEVWAECLRVLKPGGQLLCFASPRTHHRMCVNIEDAGFKVRDVISWIFGTGFPKNKNLGDGWGTALKPAAELITLARKPFSGTVTAHHDAHSIGGLNIDASRMTGGRHPTNVVFQHLPDCRRLSDKTVKAISGTRAGRRDGTGWGMKKTGEATGYGDADGNEMVADWACAHGCPVDELGKQNEQAPRFFYYAKANKKDRTEEGQVENNHKTVKPTALMRYLVRMITPKGGTVLDPFAGSGSTGKAAMLEGFEFIGVEREPEYFETAQKRIDLNNGQSDKKKKD